MFCSDVGVVTMTTDMQALKTNEFLRRRKLRLQQVREQSKDIAKKVRQRAKIEKQRHIGDLDVRKEKEYLLRQEKLVRQLEELYAKGIQNVGSGHKSATILRKDQENIPPNLDLSKVRAREAASILRHEKEQHLLKHKTLLARKAQARETANVISREKLKTSSKLLEAKTIVTDEATNKNNPRELVQDKGQSEPVESVDTVTSKVDMGTQFNFKALPQEWAPSVPILTLSNEDTEPNNDSGNSNQLKVPPNTRRMDLFAVSEEMPNSLRNSSANRLSDDIMSKPSLSLVSEYLQTRNLRLREPDVNQPKIKKTPEDFQSLKQTIQKARSTKCEAKGVKAATGESIKTNLPEDTTNRKTESAAAKKSSVTVYNHSTRDTRAMLFPSDLHVSRDQPDEDAYSQAIKESMADERDREHERKLKDMRCKIAMSKQSVEKEYKDTMSFLNSMPIEMRTGRPIKQAFMDDKRQQNIQDERQRRMNHEFAEIEKECRRRSAMAKPKPGSKRPKSKSADRNVEMDDQGNDFQYSWMPVPDNDEAMAVHTIPVTLKEGKNCVKFSKVDSYHEYRSRHKHTPPTKDVSREDDTKGVETMVFDIQDVTDSSDSDSSVQSIAIQTKHVKKTRERKQTKKQDISDTEKIIVYKIIESKGKARKKSPPHVTTLFSGDDNGRGDAERITNDNNEQGKTTTSQFTENHYGDMYNTSTDKTGSVASTSVAVDVNKSQTVNRTTTRECFCGNSRKDKSDKALPLYQWERSDGATTHIQRNSMENIPSASKQNEIRQTHVTATSSSSFKTAAPAQTVQDGLMKLVDEAGKEAGNFYIGTSGFLKDKDYEVIIKLRKKDTNEEMLNTDQVQSRAESLETRKETISSDDRLTVIEKKIESPIPSMPFDTTEIRSDGKNHESNPDSLKKSAEIQTALQANANTSNAAEMVLTNAIGTQSGQNNQEQSSAVNQQGLSTPGESNPKLLTSACTQTTLLSPVRPPILFHLSSSTSTSYMSPPERILPTFFESFPSEYVKQDRHRHEHRKHSCKCKKNKNSKKGSVDSDDPDKKSACDLKSQICKKHKHVQKHSKENVKLTAKSSDEEPCRCRKCVSAKPSKTYALMKRYSRKFMYSKNKDLKRGIKSTRLNPALKSYINKLLELNREGMRIVDVVGQDCSDVTTPASSIVNVDSNVEPDKSLSNNRITLNRIGAALLKNIAHQHESKPNLSLGKYIGRMTTENELETLFLKKFPRLMRRRSSVHKIRTLNISKKLISISSTNESHEAVHPSESRISNSKQKSPHKRSATQIRTRSNSSPTPRYIKDNEDLRDQVVNFKEIDSTELTKQINDIKSAVKDINLEKVTKSFKNTVDKKKDEPLGNNNNVVRSQVENKKRPEMRQHSTLTQTEELSSNKTDISDNKVQNMKIIAHLTDKCTKRLSDLAKVLNEVRKSKSLAYSQITTEPSSDSQPRLEKSTADKSSSEKMHCNRDYIEREAQPGSTSPSEEDAFVKSTDYMYILEGIPKPRSPLLSSPTKSSKSSGDESYLSKDQIIKLRNRPPTALSRINLKNGEDYIVPHELSTVLEVDSPMSIRVKSITNEVNENHSTKNCNIKDNFVNPDTRGKSIAGSSSTTATTKLSGLGKSKMKILDLQKFNKIMFKPYISVDEFAKQCHINLTEEIENDGPLKNTSDDNSMPSEGSLPDVIGELLKRNVITEPFKFDTCSNVNSTTISSESSVSVFAMSNVHGDKKTSNLLFPKKGNDVAETSDTLSVSSNPDLEMAFKKLGFRWASSTLKKTKESQALSTSSNTSSSSQHRNVKASTMPKASKETATTATSPKNKRSIPPKSVEQQTSITNSMTVKEFLTNELSKQITFSNKSIRRNDTEELASLYETNMNGEPHSPTNNRTVESDKNTNRARTSTPVQIYKSPTYKSSSSSNTNNTSNGLFGNVDELSSVKLTSGSFKNNSTSDKDDLTIPNFSLKLTRNSELSKSD